MKLSDLEKYNQIIVQMHDNPDADAIASAFALYGYFKSKNKNVKMIYGGKNVIRKSNLKYMLTDLQIPVCHIPNEEVLREQTFVEENGLMLVNNTAKLRGVLITVDCQYNSQNVTKFEAEHIAIIDHHQIEIEDVEDSLIFPSLSSCATLVWQLLKNEGFNVNDDENISTALYYGLYSDTNSFSEIYNPIDRDARDNIQYNKLLFKKFKNSNITQDELKIAANALLHCNYNKELEFAVVQTQQCDPNILGLISDFLLQVDIITTCLVYSINNDGYKFSVRSCIREVNAREMAAFIADTMGSGGGHYDKAGGYISKELFEKKYSNERCEEYFNSRMEKYFSYFDMLRTEDYVVDESEFSLYKKRALPIGFVRMTDLFETGTPILVRTLEGDMNLTVTEDLIIIIGINGEIYPNTEDKFMNNNRELPGKYVYEETVIESKYKPMVKHLNLGTEYKLDDYAKLCVPKGDIKILAKRINRPIKVFTSWDKEKYMVGNKGDYLAVRCEDHKDIYVINKKIFDKTYEEIK